MSPGQKVHRQHIVALALLFAAQIVLRIFAAAYYSGGNWSGTNFLDEVNYYLPAGRAILEQGLAYFQTPRSLWNGPLNPLWIALWQASIPAIKIANILILSLAGLAVWDLTRKLFGYASAYAAFLLFIIHPPLLEFGATLLTEPLFVSLMVLSLWLQIRMPFGQNYSPLAAGLAMGLAILTRPGMHLFPIILAGAVFAMRLLRSLKLFDALDRGGARLLILAIVSLLVVLPYSLKNYVYFGKPGLANGIGAVLSLGSDRLTSDADSLDAQGEERRAVSEIKKIRAHPQESFKFASVRAFEYLFAYPRGYFYPVSETHAAQQAEISDDKAKHAFEVVLICFFVSFGFATLLFMPMVRDVRLVFAAFIVYLLGWHSPAFANPRLALPLFPILAVLASGGAVIGLRYRRLLPLIFGCTVFACAAFYILFGANRSNASLVDDSVVKGTAEHSATTLSSVQNP